MRYENIIPVLGILPYYTLAIKNQKSELVIISDTVIAVRRSDLLGLHTAPAFLGKHCNMHRTHTVLPSGPLWTPLYSEAPLYSEESKGRISILYWEKGTCLSFSYLYSSFDQTKTKTKTKMSAFVPISLFVSMV